MTSSPLRDLDPEARQIVMDLLASDNAALAWLDDSDAPSVTRIGFWWAQGCAYSLVSDLSDHTTALRRDPRCSLLIGAPGAKGDPLTHPRLTLQARAAAADKAALREPYLAARPKATLYFDFTDFHLIQFDITHGSLNAGFGKAFRITPDDLTGSTDP